MIGAFVKAASVAAVAVVGLLLMPLQAPGSQPPPPEPGSPPPPVQAASQAIAVPAVEQVGPGRYRLGEIEVNKNDNSVSFPAELSMERGMLEYLLVRNGGKSYESLLRTAIEPFHLQLACLLLGMEGTTSPLAAQGSPETPTGDRVEIALRVSGELVPPERWISRSIEGVKKDVPPLTWIFTGSMVRNGRFAAQRSGSMIAVYHDPAAMIDNASPGGEMNGGWVVKEGATPPVGTPVTVVIRSLK